MSNYDRLNNPYLGRSKKSYTGIVLLLILSLIVAYGVYHYSTQSKRTAVKASNQYNTFVTEIQGKDHSKAAATFAELSKLYPQSPYTELAAMTMAKLAVDQKDYNLAEERMLWVVNQNKHSANAMIARVRLSKIYIAQDKQQEAMDILKFDYPESYKSLFEEAQGDFYLQKNDKPKAIQHYTLAIKAAPNNLPMPVLRLKLQNLGVVEFSE